MLSFDASGTAYCCADQQLPDQIRAAWDCIVWCHFKIQEHFKIHFSHHSHLQKNIGPCWSFSSSSDGNGYMAGDFSESDEDQLILLCQKQVILHTRWSAFIWRMPCYIQVLLRLYLFAILDLIFLRDQLLDFVNEKSECFPTVLILCLCGQLLCVFYHHWYHTLVASIYASCTVDSSNLAQIELY